MCTFFAPCTTLGIFFSHLYFCLISFVFPCHLTIRKKVLMFIFRIRIPCDILLHHFQQHMSTMKQMNTYTQVCWIIIAYIHSFVCVWVCVCVCVCETVESICFWNEENNWEKKFARIHWMRRYHYQNKNEHSLCSGCSILFNMKSLSHSRCCLSVFVFFFSHFHVDEKLSQNAWWGVAQICIAYVILCNHISNNGYKLSVKTQAICEKGIRECKTKRIPIFTPKKTSKNVQILFMMMRLYCVTDNVHCHLQTHSLHCNVSIAYRFNPYVHRHAHTPNHFSNRISLQHEMPKKNF